MTVIRKQVPHLLYYILTPGHALDLRVTV